MKLIVIGAGIMGLSTAWAAIRAGHTVTIIDQGAIPNEAGSSTDETRLIRHAYGSMDGYALLVDPAYAAWDRLWEDLRVKHYRPTGTLCITNSNSPWFTESIAGVERLGIQTEWLDEQALSARFPPLQPLLGLQACLIPTGGILLARALLLDLAKWLADKGAILRTDTKISAIDAEAGVCHLAEGGTLSADRLIVATGPWTPDLMGSELPLTPSRQVTVLIESPKAHADAWARMPMVLDIDSATGTFMVPPVKNGLLKVGSHRFTATGHPDDERVVGREERAALFEGFSRWLRTPDLYRLSSARACFYTVAPEERFIVRPITDRVWIMAGFSGHGFKFGPLLGEQVVLAIDGTLSAQAVAQMAAGQNPPGD